MKAISKSLAIFGMGFFSSLAGAYETIDVTEFGALPDDGQDDTAAINWAISVAPEHSWVYLPAGTYEITHALMTKANMKLAGDGREQTIIRYVGTSGDAMIFSDSVSNVEVSELTLDANHNPNAWQGIAVAGGSGHYLGNLTLKNFVSTNDWGPHAIILGGVTNSAVAYNIIQNIAPDDEWGTGIKLGWGSNQNEIVGNTISNTGRGGILCETSTDARIQDNRISGSGLGLSVEIWRCDQATIASNVLDYEVSVYDSNDVTKEPNTITKPNSIPTDDLILLSTKMSYYVNRDRTIGNPQFAHSLGGVDIRYGDIVEYDPVADIASLYLNGSEVFDFGFQRIQAAHILPDGDVIFAVSNSKCNKGVGLSCAGGIRLNSKNLYRYEADTGTIDPTPYLDWAATGFSTIGAKIDALYIRRNGNIVFSINDAGFRLGQQQIKSGDLVEYDPLAGDVIRIYYATEIFQCGGVVDNFGYYHYKPCPNIDALHFLDNGNMVLSTDLIGFESKFELSSEISWHAEDLVVYDPVANRFDPDTYLYLDGSDVFEVSPEAGNDLSAANIQAVSLVPSD